MNEQLVGARLRKGWSQEEAAEAVGVATRTYQRWEHRVSVPNFASRRLLREAFAATDEELGFSWQGKKSIEQVGSNELLDRSLKNENLSYSMFVAPTEHLLIETSSELSSAASISTTIATDIQREDYQALEEYGTHTMTQSQQQNTNISRRDMLVLLTGLSSSLLGLERLENISHSQAEEIVSFGTAAIHASWSLVYEGGIQHIEGILPRHLSYLTAVAQQSSQYRKQAARLASQGYKLMNLLDLQHEDFSAALRHSDDAFLYGQVAEDSNLQVAALIEKALTFWYRQRLPQTLATYQQAAKLMADASPMLQGRVYLGLAVASAGFGLEQEALNYMGLAQEIFPDHPENDPHFSYTYYSHYYLHLYKGLMYVHLGQPENALVAYAHFHGPQYVPRRAEIANKEASALLTLGDRDQCKAKVETAVALALSINSDLRYSQAREIYQGMLIKWPHEKNVKDLGQIFQR